MAKITFSEDAWRHYQDWITSDAKMVLRIHQLIQSILREGPMRGIGKPEKLRHREGYSRRTDERHRLIYTISGQDVTILDCYGHYE